MTDALRVTDLKVNYGGIQAVKGISLSVGQGEIVALIGANGAGKTSTLKAIVKLIASQGQIDFFGAPAGSLATHQIAARGVSLVPEGRAIFGNMSVRENLEMGAFLHRDAAGGSTTWSASSPSSPASPSASSGTGAPSPAASSRCSPSDGP